MKLVGVSLYKASDNQWINGEEAAIAESSSSFRRIEGSFARWLDPTLWVAGRSDQGSFSLPVVVDSAPNTAKWSIGETQIELAASKSSASDGSAVVTRHYRADYEDQQPSGSGQA